MRASILAWSAASGILLGVFADLLLLAVVLIVARVLPAAARWGQRVSPAIWSVALAALPVVGGVLGYLEGQLKAR